MDKRSKPQGGNWQRTALMVIVIVVILLCLLLLVFNIQAV